MATSDDLRQIFTAGRPLIEEWLDIGEQIAALRDVAASKGLDWSQLKALMKAQIQDERDETGNGKRVARIVEKAEFASAYADMLGLAPANMNENNFSASQSYAEAKGVDPKLIATVATGMQTEIGRKALVKALDIMIEAEETGEITDTQEQPETANQSEQPETTGPYEYAGTSSDENPAPIPHSAVTALPADKTGAAPLPSSAAPVAISDDSFDPSSLTFLSKDKQKPGEKPDCLKLKDGHCRIAGETSALCSDCNNARMKARAA